MNKIKNDDVTEALKKVFDPELGIDIHTLGLVYKTTIEKDNTVNILMTLTTPMCPYGPMLIEDVKEKVKAVPNVSDVKIDITFEPPWQPSDEIKAMLGIL